MQGGKWLKYLRSGILLALGIFILFFSGNWFEMPYWQRYGLGVVLVVYSLFRLRGQIFKGSR